MELEVVILAAGQGKRMRSVLPKIFHPLGGKPILDYVIETALSLKPQKTVLVLSPILEKYAFSRVSATVFQDPPQGTGDAVKCALPKLNCNGDVLVLFGDTPLVTKDTLDRLIQKKSEDSSLGVLVLGMEPETQSGYARLKVSSEGYLEEIIEDKDANEKDKDIRICNSGVMLVEGGLLKDLLPKLTPNNAQGEYYLTDLVKLARSTGRKCGYVTGHPDEFMGINSREDMAQVETILQNRWRKKFMAEGVTLRDPASTYFSYDTDIAHDVTIHPGVVFGSGVKIETGAEILPYCRISESHIGPWAVVGPFAHLRPGTKLEEKAEVGNFVEVKKSTFRKGAKAKHLSYVGDTDVGEKANIGAGTITANYDGFSKFKTKIGAHVLIGSNSTLVAPVDVEAGAIVGAGSVITEDVPQDTLALARGRQVNLEGRAKLFRDEHQKKKEA
ncbi:Bifunctional UDP-N-acetylglucosamine diphosphorylase/glucosamine-1-phosphate N-acetyltransferase GlmU [Candidatus Bealeia paramacronuclearis]|uniref:Bifunctional protein GlmU n=1 Tax=Candidatus Bealeia paramacronuclearis TaxID=1921001 RepID=A0ABZ2C4F8_9PROT|nr:Bifunctional UDP-N-acetylglucosamine diphosphorylase/glucosamine-1-phosphate N-acetyltransferase GlmU [Candidatus Bealeia paramacronuclearis]